MRQLVKQDQRDLRALPVGDGLFVLKVGHRNRRAGREFPVQHVLDRLSPEQRIEFGALIPQAALVADLDRGSPQKHRAKVRVVDVSQGFHQERPCFAAPSPAPVNGNIAG